VTAFWAHLAAWLNSLANALGLVFLAPVAYLPGWLSATLVASVTGVLMLIVFKYTSNQRAIQGVRNRIKANLLAPKLFKDSASVALQSQGRILVDAFLLIVHALVPMLVMLLPVTLILGQLALWYQSRPLRVGEEAVLVVKLTGDVDSPWPDVRLEESPAFDVEVGPVRVQSQREICWNIQARTNGYHKLVLSVDGQTIEKDLAVGDGFMRVSLERPAMGVQDALLNPWEKPFGSESPVQSIAVAYPERQSWTSGTDWWIFYWFVVSMLSALCFRGVFKVNV
jgi:hypothetical protein